MQRDADRDIERALELLQGSGRAFSLSIVGPDGDLYTWTGTAPAPEPYAPGPASLFDLERREGRIVWRAEPQGAEESAEAATVTVVPAWDGSRVPVATGYFSPEGRLTVTLVPCPVCSGSGLGPEAEVFDDLAALGGEGTSHSCCYACGGTGEWTAEPLRLPCRVAPVAGPPGPATADDGV